MTLQVGYCQPGLRRAIYGPLYFCRVLRMLIARVQRTPLTEKAGGDLKCDNSTRKFVGCCPGSVEGGSCN